MAELVDKLDSKSRTVFFVEDFCSLFCRSGGIGRRAGLKIQSGSHQVPVRVRPSVQQLLYIMFFVYALKSISHNFIYVGMTENLEERIRRHNNGYVKSTKRYTPYNLIYSETCQSGIQAREREKYLKSSSGKRFLKSILERAPYS